MLDLRAQYESIAPEIRAAIDAVLARQQFVLGPECEALEAEIAQLCGTRHGVGVASGTEALELTLHACGVSAGDEVIVPAFTFIATGSAVSALGARPVFADIEPVTYNLDPEQLEILITPRTRAIVAVHLFGLAADMDPILAIAAKHGIPVIEDNAQSLGATYQGKKTGSMGRAGCLSFYPSKNLGAYGDAGMIVTNDDKLATRLRSLRNHGQTGRYVSTERGWNSRLDELQAAILRVKLRHLQDWTAACQGHARRYDALLRDLPGITLPRVPAGREHVYYLYTLQIAARATGNDPRGDNSQRRGSTAACGSRRFQRGLLSCTAASSTSLRIVRGQARRSARQRASLPRSAFHSALPADDDRASGESCPGSPGRGSLIILSEKSLQGCVGT